MAVKNYKEAVEAKIKQAPSLVAALESVAAMYGIPSENIIVDDRANGISVQGDMIYTPDRPNPSANTKSIVCAIGAVLDNISQRIDKKLDAYQAQNIANGVKVSTQRQADPSKGTVVGRFFDSNGGEIIAYSSGLVDMDKTPEALAKVEELRKSGQIPDIPKDDKPAEKKSGYFSDEDDVMKNVPSSDPEVVDLSNNLNDIPAQIHESAKMVDLYDRLHGSITMGYDLLRRQGFDFVEPTHALIQEAASDSLSDSMNGDSKKTSTESTSTSTTKVAGMIQHMKFDNSKILEAIKLFNEAYKQSSGLNFKDEDKEPPKGKTMEIPDPDDPTKTKTVELAPEPEPEPKGTVNTAKLMKLPEWKMAVKCLEQQFDCRLRIDRVDSPDANMYTMINDLQRREKLIISKSKGFQLSRMVIKITIVGDILESFTRHTNPDLFGQKLISVFLHEIFHNIAQQLRQYDDSIITVLSSTMMLATSTRSVKTRRIIFTNYVNHLVTLDGKKMGRFAKRKMIKQLLSISAIQYNMRAVEEYKKALESGKQKGDVIDKYVEKLEKQIAHEKKWMEKRSKTSVKIFNTIMFLTGICLLPVFGAGLIVLFGMLFSPTVGMNAEQYEKRLKEYLENPYKEEYYCDMFAGIYNLPPTFLLGDMVKGKTAKTIDDEKLKRLAKAEKEIFQLYFVHYPTDSERCYAALRIAKNALESGIDLAPEIKAYLEWIVDNYKNIENANIKEDYNAGAFNPEEAEDLDAHIQRIIDEGEVTVTEQAQ